MVAAASELCKWTFFPRVAHASSSLRRLRLFCMLYRFNTTSGCIAHCQLLFRAPLFSAA